MPGDGGLGHLENGLEVTHTPFTGREDSDDLHAGAVGESAKHLSGAVGTLSVGLAQHGVDSYVLYRI
jgi:hypothetical protein